MLCILIIRSTLSSFYSEIFEISIGSGELFCEKIRTLDNRMKSCSAPPSIMAGSIDGGQAGGAGLADSGEELSCEWEACILWIFKVKASF